MIATKNKDGAIAIMVRLASGLPSIDAIGLLSAIIKIVVTSPMTTIALMALRKTSCAAL